LIDAPESLCFRGRWGNRQPRPVPDGMTEIRAPITGNVWKVLVAVGDAVRVDDVVAILESMKLEIPVEAESAGIVLRVLVSVGEPVGEDDAMFELE